MYLFYINKKRNEIKLFTPYIDIMKFVYYIKMHSIYIYCIYRYKMAIYFVQTCIIDEDR